MFIQTEATPNPATLKFVPGRTVVSDGPFEFTSIDDVQGRSPLAEQLFSVNGVISVFFGLDFITITKEDSINWDHIKPAILGVIMEHFLSDSATMTADGIGADDPIEEVNDEGSQEIVAAIKELLDTRVRPAVAQDGGDVMFQGFRDGRVYLRMRGACAGCPSSSATLQYGIQNLLKHFIPEVVSVEAV